MPDISNTFFEKQTPVLGANLLKALPPPKSKKPIYKLQKGFLLLVKL